MIMASLILSCPYLLQYSSLLGTFNKYDDAIHPELSKIRKVGKVLFGVSAARQADGRDATIKSMLSNWKSFLCNESKGNGTAQEAVQSFLKITKSLVFYKVLEDKPHCQPFSISPTGFVPEKVFQSFLANGLHRRFLL